MNGKEASRNRFDCGSLRSAARSLSCAVAIACTVLAASAQAQNPPGNTVYDLVPIGSTGTVTSLVGNSIEIPSGGVVVELELRVSNWATTGDGELLLVQATMDGSSYCSGAGDPLYPVGYPGSPVLSCPQGLGCPDDGSTCDQGGFVTTKRCSGGDFEPCRKCSGIGEPCLIIPCSGPLSNCLDNPFYVFTNTASAPIAAVAYLGLDYQYVGISTGVAVADTGQSKMFGTLLVEIPPGAAGTYNINFLQDSETTFTVDGVADSFAVVNLNGATITVTSGSCCFDIGSGITGCLNDVTQTTCDAQAGLSSFTPNGECPPLGQNNIGPDSGNGCCPVCLDNAGCDDSNACTDDSCTAGCGQCINTINYDDATDCCSPASGNLSTIDDQDSCTDDICNAQSGLVNHVPSAVCNGECTSIAAAVAGDCPDSIPTVSEWGLVVLSLLLLVCGKLYFGRREATA